jgi:hypothetical protein
VPSGQWTHICFTNAGGGSGGTFTLYINGLAVSTTPDNGDVSWDVVSSQLGAGNGATSNALLDGREYNWVIYNRALSAGEALQLKNAF